MSRSYDQEVVQKVAVTVLSSHCCTDSESERIKKQKNTPIDMSLLGFHCSPPQQSPPRGKTESGTDEKRFVKINTTGTLSIGGKCLLGMIFMSFCGQTSRSTFGKKISSCDFWGGLKLFHASKNVVKSVKFTLFFFFSSSIFYYYYYY